MILEHCFYAVPYPFDGTIKRGTALRKGRSAIREFAKASIFNLIVSRLKRSNPDLIPAGIPRVDAARQALIPAAFKRNMLDDIWREAGVETLLSIGREVKTVGNDPIWNAAKRSANPPLFFDKWQRFEVFAHSQNRVRIDQLNDNLATFERYTEAGQIPTPPENLLICGLLIALLEEIGCLGLCCEMPLCGGEVFTIYDQKKILVPENTDLLETGTWSINWQSFSPDTNKNKSSLGLPEVALPVSVEPKLKALYETISLLLTGDISRQWKVGELAREVGLSTRSLQRKLRDGKLGFSSLVRLVRIHEACRLLKDSRISVTAIGFCTGFSDTAHFSRDFRASMGMSPKEFRTIS